MKGIQNTITDNFSSILSNNRYFFVPKFQRDYSWESEQWDDLWQDILTMLDEHDEHYMGYLVLQTNGDKKYYIIDGQQRFTTIILLILATIKNISKLIEQGIAPEDNKLRIEKLTETYIGKQDPVTLKYDNILQLNRNNDAYFRDYIVRLKDFKVRNLKTTEKLMKQCFEFFDQKLSGRYHSGEEYAQFIQNVVDNLYFTQIIVNDEMNAFRVFETLNARGVQLSSADLLKNYLFALVDKNNSHESYIDQLEEEWARLTDNIKAERLPEFLRYFWNTSHKAIRANEVFKTIRREITSDKQVFQLIRDMLDFSDIYMALRDSNDETWTDEEVRQDIALLNLFQIKQPYSMLMTAKKNLPDTDFKKLLHVTIILCFRYNIICDRNPNDQEGPFNNMAMLISHEKKMDMKLLASIMVEDAEFQHAFQEKLFPIRRNAKLVRYILGLIEKFKGSNLDVQFDDETVTIEHILPQGYDDTWNVDENKADRLVNRLGNLCLLEPKLNKELQNKPFDIKAKIYSQSHYYYAKTIADEYPSWDENAICRRQAEMSKAAVSIWRLKSF
ncbi:MAG: DUF262 domain-containing HNH endonuclease family protein [Lentisphaeria bacterium]|nr:DUF262 domain-containing HNH endonuclease family protein [Lentisphaeria bacterium]